MKSFALLPAVALLAFSSQCLAQAGAPRIPDAGDPTEELRTRNSMSQSEIKRLAEMMEQWNRVEGKGGLTPREAKRRTAQMLKVLAVS
jgi:hypothetical protein